MADARSPRAGPLSVRSFRDFWLASTLSGLGSYVTVVAVQVLVVVDLGGSAAQVGLVSSARWLPYLLFGLAAGVLVDRCRRRPLLAASDACSAVVLVAIPVMSWIGAFNLPALLALMVVFGALTLVHDSASQSFLPRTVPRRLITAANARLDQSDAVAQTAGPALGGTFVAALTAPVAVLVDAFSYVVSALLVARTPIAEEVPGRAERHLRRELTDGLRWVYRHPTLMPFAVWTHAWFLFVAVFNTVVTPFVLRQLGLNAVGLGLLLAAAGIGALAGSTLATRLGARFGVGPVTIGCWALTVVAFAVVALAPLGVTGGAVVAIGQLLFGLALGAENANTMGYRQTVTPDRLQARMNTTMRSVNRGVVVIGAPLGGVLADAIGFRPALWVATAGMAAVTAGIALSPFRRVGPIDAD
ncbi:MFS transporter [Jatrophihabitans sp. YIM 134969]